MIDSSALLAAAGGDYQISRSVRLRSSASAYFTRTLAASNTKKWTWSGWLKRGKLGAQQVIFGAAPSSNAYSILQFTAGDQLAYESYQTTLSAQLAPGSMVCRDPSSFYHIVVLYDSAQATASERIKFWINGQLLSLSGTFPAQNADSYINAANAHGIGSAPASYAGLVFDGLIAEVNFIDGQALTAPSFGEFDAITGVWKPKKYSGTYGTNGFYLTFSDNSAATATAIGADKSGNGNNWTPTNISVTAGATYDSMLDVPTPWLDGGNGRGNYCVLNPLDQNGVTVSDGNLSHTTVSGRIRGTIFPSSGKWYFEASFSALPSTTSVGIANITAKINTSNDAQTRGYLNTGSKISNGTSSAYGAAFTTGDVIGVAFDIDAGTLIFYKNGVSQGTAFTDIAGDSWAVFIQGGYTGTLNFGQRPFSYTVPTGYKALNTANLPDPTIRKPNQYFDAVVYSGDGTSSRTISGLSFQPDLIWDKPRGTVFSHILVDSVRGGSPALAVLQSNATDAEYTTLGVGGSISAITSSGFTITAGSGTNNNLNASGSAYVAWNWKKGATPGFDIVTYTGTGAARTIAHGLGVAPSMMIVKERNVAGNNWQVWHKAFGTAGTTDYVLLNSNVAKGGGGAVDDWNNTVPTSSVFSIGTFGGINANGNSYVAYLFSEVAGFSKFGSYTGNGSTDGPFVYCGFRPRYVMVKRTDATGDWQIIDTARNTYNYADSRLWADLTNIETSNGAAGIDALSNGFKFRGAISTDGNASGGTYVFVAFAESPFKYSLAR